MRCCGWRATHASPLRSFRLPLLRRGEALRGTPKNAVHFLGTPTRPLAACGAVVGGRRMPRPYGASGYRFFVGARHCGAPQKMLCIFWGPRLAPLPHAVLWLEGDACLAPTELPATASS